MILATLQDSNDEDTDVFKPQIDTLASAQNINLKWETDNEELMLEAWMTLYH